MCVWRRRSRLNALLERVRAIELMITNKEEEMEREALKEWKTEKVGVITGTEA